MGAVEADRACSFHVKRIPFLLVDARDTDRSLTSVRALTGVQLGVDDPLSGLRRGGECDARAYSRFQELS